MLPVIKGREAFGQWLSKKRLSFDDDNESVRKVIAEVKKDGNQAVRKYTLQFDGVDLEQFRVSPAEENRALALVDRKIITILEKLRDKITDYHQKQKAQNWFYTRNGRFFGQVYHPIPKAGLYVPGGKGIYPSTVLMTAVPAKVAGVPEVYMITPPNKQKEANPLLVAAAKVCEVTGIFKAGGVQGVAALAYGTEEFPKVNKIVGPGSLYVTLAKKNLYGTVDIDSLAGPSEVMILGDEQVPMKYIVTDFLAQAEHSEDNQSVVLLPNAEMAEIVQAKIIEAMKVSKRRTVLEKSVQDNSCIYVYGDLNDAYGIINFYAPEHLEILSDKIPYYEIAEKVQNAGAIFLGPNTPVALGDYGAGPNHTLPTSGTAYYASPLGVYDFMKCTSMLQYNREALLADRDDMIQIAELEGFIEHANSLRIRD